MSSSIDEMKFEYEKIRKQKQLEASIKFSRKAVNGMCYRN